jgi:hypothetical protein
MHDMRSIILLATSACLLLTAELDPKVQAKATWSAAAKAGDVWTCLQLEAWARSRTPVVRLGSVLGESVVTGEALFSFPSGVQTLQDLGDRILVATSSRAHVLALDGRPLQPAVALLNSWRQVVGYAGTVIGSATGRGNELIVRATRLSDGEMQVEGTVPMVQDQWIGSTVVAEDGSAMAVELNKRVPTGTGPVIVDTWLMVAGARARALEVPAGLVGVGRKGAWLISGGSSDKTLVVGERRQRVTAAAVGPGIAVCLGGTGAQVILADGAQAALAGAPGLGDAPSVVTVGGWLVLASGAGAKVVSQGDFLGEGAGVEVVQPPTLAMWRWADLAADPAAKPVVSMPGALSVASQFPAALWGWEGRRVDLIDLSGPECRREPYLEASARIDWASTSQHCLRLDHPEGIKTLYGPDHGELWSGPCASVEVKRRDLAVVHRQSKGQHTWALSKLASDPSQRVETQLDLPDQRQPVRVSLAPPDLVIARGEGNSWRRLGFDGAVSETGRTDGPDAAQPPQCPEWSWFTPVGRYWRDGARVRIKAAAPAEDPLANIHMTDAWRVPGRTVLLDKSGRMLVSGRKRGEWVDLPAVAPVDRLAMSGPNLVVAAGERTSPVAVLIQGPKLEARDGLPNVRDLPTGLWRLESSGRFTPPQGRQMMWDEERLGWWPGRLRSPESGGLLVVTPAVLIELEAGSAKLVGK